MIGEFFTKPVGEAKFCRFRNIIMHISHEKYGFDVDKLMAIHNEKMVTRFNVVVEGSIADNYEMDEHSITKEQDPAESSSQEFVEDRSKRSNMMWARVRNAHKRSKDNEPVNRGQIHRHTYAEVATPASE